MATHAHAVLVTMNPIALLFANDAREITSGNDETPGFGVVVLTAEVLVDVGLALQPGKQEGAIWGACLLQNAGGWESRRCLFGVQAVLNARLVLCALTVEDLSQFGSSATTRAVGMCVVEGEPQQGCFHAFRVEAWNAEECRFVLEHRGMPCSSGVLLRLDSDFFTANFVHVPAG